MFSGLARIVMFLSSYTPLAFIFFVQYVGKNNGVAIVAVASICIGVGGMYWILRQATSKRTSVTRTIVDFDQSGESVMGYVAAYLIPFAGFPLGDIRDDIALSAFLVVLAYLYVTTDMLHINPLLHLFHYHVYDVSFESGNKQRVIAKHGLAHDEVLSVVRVDRSLWIEGAGG